MQKIDLGLISYAEAFAIQEEKNQLVASETVEECIIFCEHLPVFTFGKSAKKENLLVSSSYLAQNKIDLFKTTRGGDITFHGPGQIIIYPIINLRRRKMGVKQYIYILENAIINTLKSIGIPSFQIEGKTGIWTDETHKICAIGIRIKQGVSMHGLALNLNVDKRYYKLMVPCGIANSGISNISDSVETDRIYIINKIWASLKDLGFI